MSSSNADKNAKGKLIVAGGSHGKSYGVKPVVVSTCEFQLKSEDDVEECEKALVQFERILSKRPANEVFYEWKDVRRAGLVVSFCIHWFDMQFFLNRKEAYRYGPHPFAFQRFNLSADEILIDHQVIGSDSS